VVHNSYRAGGDVVFDPKPAYLAARTLATLFAGFRFERRERIGSDDEYVLIFRKADAVRIAAWTTDSRARRVVIPSGLGTYTTTTHTGATGAVLNAGKDGIAITLTNSPIYLMRDPH